MKRKPPFDFGKAELVCEHGFISVYGDGKRVAIKTFSPFDGRPYPDYAEVSDAIKGYDEKIHVAEHYAAESLERITKLIMESFEMESFEMEAFEKPKGKEEAFENIMKKKYVLTEDGKLEEKR